jgi:phosphatidylserine/phosphatidylglycerophosphate/cardiolipin synthase-like enzyme
VTAPLLPVAVTGARVRLVPDADYAPTLQAMIAGARWRLLCSIFIVDLAPARDRELVIDTVLLDLQEARWRGVDVRLLIGGSRTNFEIAELSDLARARALQLGIDCRWMTSTRVRGSHTKLVVADEDVLTGSHNWSLGAFTNQLQDSVLVSSPDLAAYCASLFRRQWRRAR